MINLRKNFVIVLASIVNLTEGTENSGSRRIFELPSLCYPEDRVTSDRYIVPQIKILTHDDEKIEVYELGNDSRSVIKDPCVFNWMKTSILEDFYIVVSNGTISYASDFDNASRFDVEHFCLFRELKSSVYVAKVCKPWIKIVYWQISCLIFATIVMLLILIVYTILPQLGNLHGLVFRAYLATYVTAHLCAMGQQLSSGSRDNQLFTFFGNATTPKIVQISKDRRLKRRFEGEIFNHPCGYIFLQIREIFGKTSI